jgi:lysozyme
MHLAGNEMIHSEQATEFIASFEGLRLEAYQDQGGVWTIGYGHTLGVHSGDTCDKPAALTMLDADLLKVDKALGRLVTVPVSQNQYDALTSLVFNIGQGNFGHSTVLDLLIRGEMDGAANAFLMWNKVHGNTNAGLDRRRQAERQLFLKP